uniref:Photosystem I reaction center subunit III n=1 Tax=Pleurostichidium falkenbergii TaxID=121064 RepID=A0A4D6UY29_9FLOR|nr:photosystem I reaction center subunit III [Pleurostichidium falkenbergii]QCH39568.1 photosystem I reaction center subunit III [Pleurostichidium falkenbergii]
MKKNMILLSFVLLSLFNFQPVYSEVAGLIPCKDSPAFSKRLKSSLKKLEVRMAKYETSTPPALALQSQINQTQSRFDKYSKAGILCGTEGLPHLIADGRWNHAGDFMIPGLLFIYITGWIGWVGRGYLRAVSSLNKPAEKEIIIDVPLAMKFSLSGFTWPLAALQEFTSGQLIASDEDITISPR